ncbi:hypothetical protein P3T42_007325 [Paraburkholderia sp. GAS38]|uniref:hypothetical protein n=1 Tax=Paraburkholderia sp. GAS38 TaxID=3035133 RepID=UPI003D1C5E09
MPDANGELRSHRLVIFDSLGWKPNPFLLTKIEFKPPIVDQLAKEAGIDPAALDLLRKLGITSVADLTSRLGIADLPPGGEDEPGVEAEPDTSSDGDVYDDAKDLYGDDMPDIPPGTPDPDGGDNVAGGGTGRGGEGHSGSTVGQAAAKAPEARDDLASVAGGKAKRVTVTKERDLPAKREGALSFPTSALILIRRSVIRTGSIRRRGCGSRSTPLT